RRAAVRRLDRQRAPRLDHRARQRADGRQRRVRAGGVPADRAGAAARPVAHGPAGADDLPGRLRLGGPAGRRALDHPADPDRGDPHRHDELAAAGAARIPPGRGDHVSAEPSPETQPEAQPESSEEPEQERVPILALDRLSLSFGGLRAVSELEFHVGDREVVSVIGPNGAGKTTVFNLITGVYRPDDGDIVFAGQSICGRAQHVIARLGIARTFQSLRLFPNMSVLENVMAATYGGTRATPVESVLRLPRARREEREVRALAVEVLSFFGQRLAGYRWD